MHGKVVTSAEYFYTSDFHCKFHVKEGLVSSATRGSAQTTTEWLLIKWLL